MKHKQLLFILLFILLSQSVFGQCPNIDTLIFSTQSEIDDFLIDYPDCSSYAGNILIEEIENGTIENINNLENLISVGGDLIIQYNSNLQNLSGLENINTVGGRLDIRTNSSLLNLNGIDNISSVGGSLIIWINDNLQNLNGLENIISVGETLTIWGNNNLLNINALENLDSIGESLSIRHNDSLQDLIGLQNISSIEGGYSMIQDNDALISLNGLQYFDSIVGTLAIWDNDNLQNLNGLENLIDLTESLSIKYNDALVTLNGLEGISTFSGNIIIEDNLNLQNLDGLENLDSIGGGLTIRNNASLLSLTSLENLSFISGSIVIQWNNNLQNLYGLHNLSSFLGDVRIQSNNGLINLAGLDGINSIGGQLHIDFNDNLQNLYGLHNLSSISGRLRINDNENLISLSGFENLNFIGWDLYIHDNQQLSFCSITPVCNSLLSSATAFNIYNNSEGCNDSTEILSTCEGIGRIHHPVFYDQNENGTHENGEPFLSNQYVVLQPGNIKSYGNARNGGIKYVNFGEYAIELELSPSSNWDLTDGNSTYTVNLDEVVYADTVYFPLFPSSFTTDIKTVVVASQPRCNEWVTLSANVINNGTTTADGMLWISLDENIEEYDFVDVPDSIIGQQQFGWQYETLFPSHTFSKTIKVRFPGPPDFEVGGILTFPVQTNFVDENGSGSYSDALRVTVLCSYDPNDKLVQPQYPENYALTSEDLTYTIRFQNTGNAEAYDVVLKDTLDENLDLSTFRYITSSHEQVLSTYLEDRVLTFEFKDIFLPDSTTNFDESQGYVMYSIRGNEDVEDFTPVENTAHIYFDYNPAVVTNMTENTMVSTFDFDEDGFLLWEDCDDNNPDVYPDAEEIPNNGIDEDCDGADLLSATQQIIANQPIVFPNPTRDVVNIRFSKNTEGNYQLQSVDGRVLLEGPLGKETMVDLESLAQGVYVLLLKTQDLVYVERIIKG